MKGGVKHPLFCVHKTQILFYVRKRSTTPAYRMKAFCNTITNALTENFAFE